jgi:two-component system heavy metal sensor histidine kinase CusS
MAGAAALTLLAAWYGVHQGHAPLRKLSNDIQQIQSDKLHVRLDPANTPIELQDLVLSFNHMLGRLEEGFTRLSNFSADIAHELRTPLMNLITQTQVGLGKARQQEEYRELLYSNLEEQEKLAKMVGDMLWLAQTDHGLIKPVFDSLDLAEEINTLFEYFGAWAEESGVKLILEGECQRVQGDRAMLRRAISNLLSNAIQHTPAGGSVVVILSSMANGFTSLAITNPGATIPPEHLPRIFDRFYRVDQSRQRQHESGGLGLAIVKSIIELHDGKVGVTSANGLTTFTVVLPAVMTTAGQRPGKN